MEKNVMLTPLALESRRWRDGGRCLQMHEQSNERRAA
jgi:hypothetical protein